VFSDKSLDIGFNWGRIALIANLERRAAHSAVLEHPAESRTLAGYAPVGDKVRYQKVERRIVRRRHGAPETRLLRVSSTPFRKVARIFQQVVCIRHLLCPRFFARRRLLGFASEVVVCVYAKGVEIQMFGETPLHTVCHLAQAILGGIVRQNDPERIWPTCRPSPRLCCTGYAPHRA
jgi:hypothetical protein